MNATDVQIQGRLEMTDHQLESSLSLSFCPPCRSYGDLKRFTVAFETADDYDYRQPRLAVDLSPDLFESSMVSATHPHSKGRWFHEPTYFIAQSLNLRERRIFLASVHGDVRKQKAAQLA